MTRKKILFHYACQDREKACQVVTVKLFLTSAIAMFSQHVIERKKSRANTLIYMQYTSSRRVSLLTLEYGRRRARICACVDIRPNCFSLCMFPTNKSTHHHHHHPHHQTSLFSFQYIVRLVIASSRFPAQKKQGLPFLSLYYFSPGFNVSSRHLNPYVISYRY